MGLCNSNDTQNKVHLTVIFWKKNQYGLFNYKDNINSYEVNHYILDKDTYIYYDQITNKVLFNDKLFKNKYSAKM